MLHPWTAHPQLHVWLLITRTMQPLLPDSFLLLSTCLQPPIMSCDIVWGWGEYAQMSTQPRLGTNDRQNKYTIKVQLDEPTNLVGFLQKHVCGVTYRSRNNSKSRYVTKSLPKSEWQPMKVRIVVLTEQLACYRVFSKQFNWPEPLLGSLAFLRMSPSSPYCLHMLGEDKV